MRIKFKVPDPRAGTIAQMDSGRGQHFIDIGSAVMVKENATEGQSEIKPTGGAPVPRLSQGMTVADLKAALEAKGITIPDGAKKQDLADLLDGAE